MRPVGFNQTVNLHRPVNPSRQKSKIQSLAFAGVTGSETFTITTDFPESLNERFKVLQQERGQTSAQVIQDGLSLLKLFADAKKKDPSCELLWLKDKPGFMRLYTDYQAWQLSRRTPINPAEKTVPQAFDFSVEAYVDLKETASILRRSLEQTLGDVITVLWNIREFKQHIPEGHLGLMVNGSLREIVGNI